MHPLKRVGPKGSGQFRRIGWDEALDEIAARLKDVAADDPQGILPLSYAGTMGMLQYSSMDRRFFHKLGASQLERTLCSSAGKAGIKATLGRQLRHGPGALPGREADPDLGLQSDHLEPAFLGACAGSQAAAARRSSRSIPTAA